MANKEHINSTQAIAAVGYSLSAMLLALAAALYLGWLPANGGEPGTAQIGAGKPEIPVVKSPERPAKTRVTELPPEESEPEPLPETAERAEPPAPVPAEEPEQPEEVPEIVEEVPPAEPATPEPSKIARIAPREHHTPLAFPLEEPVQEPEPVETAEAEQEPTETVQKEQQPAETEPTETAEVQPDAGTEAEPTPAPEGTAPTAEPEEAETAETPAGELRIVTPPTGITPSEPAPRVVIRIPPQAEEPLDELPRPIAVPRGKPKIVERPASSESQDPAKTEKVAERPAIPRPKPLKRKATQTPTVPEPKVAVSEPTPEPAAPKTAQPAAPAPKTDALSVEAGDEPPASKTPRVPRPQAKPKRQAASPTHTATVGTQAKQAPKAEKRVKRAPKAQAQRKRQRATKRTRLARAQAKPRRAQPGRVRIHRPPVTETVSLDQDTYCLAMAIYHEAGSRNLQQQVAVSRDILHRVESFNFPNSVCDVVYQFAHRRGRCRYAFACDGLPDRPRNKSVWRRAKVLARAHMACGSRCGCTLQRPTLVSNSESRNRRVIRCSATIRTPASQSQPREVAQGAQLRIKPVSSRRQKEPVSALGRLQP